jgi:hypothetical protein
MKYFTPDLLHRFRSEDEAMGDAAQEEWDRASEKYRKHLERLKPPPAAGRLRKLCLHDAKVWMVSSTDNGARLSLILGQHILDHHRIVSLRYDLERSPKIIEHPDAAEPGAPSNGCMTNLAWLAKRMLRPLPIPSCSATDVNWCSCSASCGWKPSRASGSPRAVRPPSTPCSWGQQADRPPCLPSSPPPPPAASPFRCLASRLPRLLLL